MENNKNAKLNHTDVCTEHTTCLFRIELLEKWKESVERKMDNLAKLLIANLTGVILTLLGGIVGLLIYIAQ